MRLFLFLLALAGMAHADERFDKLDYNQDGKISKAEAAGNADLINGFDRADRNKDGKLSPKEYDALLARIERAQKAAEAKGSSATGSTAPRRERRRSP
jgi:Ca2+-binding EF-hand superfamily protein